MAQKQKEKQPLTPAAKAAAVIVALGATHASQVYKHLREEEIETLSLEVAKLNKLPPEELQEIMDDFYGLCMTQKVIAEGGVVYARDILSKAFGDELAESYMNRISNAMQVRAMDFIRKANYKSIFMMLQNEHPQTIAFVMSYAKADQSSKVIAELPKKLQIDVVKRIATIENVSPDVVNVIEGILEKKFSTIVSTDMTEVGGVNYVAEVMNSTDRTTEKYIFDELTKTDPVLSDDIRKLMFVFEDIALLDDMSIQRVLREIDQQDLAVAIKGSSEEVKSILLENVSARSRQSILEDIQYLRNVRLKDVEESQQKIVNVIRTLEETGEIVISKGGDDNAVIG